MQAQIRPSRALAWLQDRPRALQWAYGFSLWAVKVVKPVLFAFGEKRADQIFRFIEEPPKKVLFDCRMCGQCILHSTGMTCPMNCPKNLRNGPCGGVRANGHCEIVPEMPCVWVQAWERSTKMGDMGREIFWLQPPVNRRLEGTSAWVNMLTGADQELPPDWEPAAHAS
jgi:hypothetical protein